MPLIYLMVSIGDLYGLLNFYSFSRWFFIGLATLGLLIQRYKHPELPRPFKVKEARVEILKRGPKKKKKSRVILF